MSLVLRDIRNGTALDEVTLEDGTLHYMSGVAKDIIEGVQRTRMLSGKGKVTDTEIFSAMTGWTNGYLRLDDHQ